MIRRLAKRTQTTHEKGDGYGARCNVGAVDHDLEGSRIGAQHDVLATTGVDQDVLQAAQVVEKYTAIRRGCDVKCLGHRRER